uniref:proline rich transmembrane protein 1B-like n=1 Tax=Podarcis muralis TaxID=64176 RepID=UPI00109F0767|nr:proline rich transmembrane protein 1B-like [Podarcis muralis]
MEEHQELSRGSRTEKTKEEEESTTMSNPKHEKLGEKALAAQNPPAYSEIDAYTEPDPLKQPPGPAPQAGYGLMPAPHAGYGAMPAPQAGYGPMPAPQAGYGAMPAPQARYGAMPAPQAGYGAMPYYGPPVAGSHLRPVLQPPQAVYVTPVEPTNEPDYLIYSIFTMLCCCLPLGIVALVYSIQTREANFAGNAASAERNSRMARLFSHLAFGIGLGLLILYIIIVTRNFR